MGQHDTYCEFNKPSCKCVTCKHDNKGQSGKWACCFKNFQPCPVKECKNYEDEITKQEKMDGILGNE